MLIPEAIQPIIMKEFNIAYQGVSSMLANACERFSWP